MRSSNKFKNNFYLNRFILKNSLFLRCFSRRSILYFFAASLLLIVINFSICNNHPEYDNYGLIIAHRGASGLAPENTLASIVKAMELNADIIEIDVHQTKDSVLVVLHDDTIDRITNREGKVCEITFNEIRKHDVEGWFHGNFYREKIPSLREVLSVVNGKSKLLIEVKGNNEDYPNIEEHIYNLLCEFDALDWILIHSFDDDILKKFYKLDSTIELHKLIVLDFPLIPLFIDKTLKFGRISDYKHLRAINVNSFFVSESLIDNIHELGCKINVWTVNDSTEIEEFFKMGVDGIITNFPNYRRRAL